jgi:hypothetical protein
MKEILAYKFLLLQTGTKFKWNEWGRIISIIEKYTGSIYK